MDKSDELKELFAGELTPENRDRRLLALADHLDTCKDMSSSELGNYGGNWIGERPPEFFTMSDVHYPCGSPACLVGHGLVLAGHSLPAADATEEFSNIYGVSDHLANELYAPQTSEYGWGWEIGNIGHITPHHAASVIRHLVEIGVVDWDGIGQKLGVE